jgi:hypothetical protein
MAGDGKSVYSKRHPKRKKVIPLAAGQPAQGRTPKPRKPFSGLFGKRKKV